MYINQSPIYWSYRCHYGGSMANDEWANRLGKTRRLQSEWSWSWYHTYKDLVLVGQPKSGVSAFFSSFLILVSVPAKSHYSSRRWRHVLASTKTTLTIRSRLSSDLIQSNDERDDGAYFNKKEVTFSQISKRVFNISYFCLLYNPNSFPAFWALFPLNPNRAHRTPLSGLHRTRTDACPRHLLLLRNLEEFRQPLHHNVDVHVNLWHLLITALLHDSD